MQDVACTYLRFMMAIRLLVIVFALGIIGACFAPWVYIAPKQIMVSGMAAESINFGKPGLFHIFLASLFLILVLLNKTWSLRIAFFIGAFNIAWVLRNYIAVSACSGGICPQKQYGLFLLLSCSLLSLFFLLFISKAGTK